MSIFDDMINDWKRKAELKKAEKEAVHKARMENIEKFADEKVKAENKNKLEGIKQQKKAGSQSKIQGLIDSLPSPDLNAITGTNKSKSNNEDLHNLLVGSGKNNNTELRF